MSVGPYFITTLEVDIQLYPNQMNNNINENIKHNIEKSYLNKCYNKYGYIDKIYDIDPNIRGGIIRADDFSSASTHRIKFNCRICNPLKDSIIMGKIIKISNRIIVAENGPIKFIIQDNNYNNTNIQFKKTAYYPVISGVIINKPLFNGTYIMIKVLGKRLMAGSLSIIVFGYMEAVVNDDAVSTNLREQYNTNNIIDVEKL